MIWIDYLILSIIGFSALISLIRGFVREALSLVTWTCAFFVASRYYMLLAPFFSGISNSVARNGMAIALLFIATLLVGAVVNYTVGLLVDKTGLSGTDRLLGVCFGALRGVLITAAILFCLDLFTAFPRSDAWQQSRLIPEFKPIIGWFFNYLHSGSSFIALKSY